MIAGQVACAPFSRRSVLAGVAAAFTVGCGRKEAQAAQTQVRNAIVSLSHFGVDRFSTRDQMPRLAAAFAAAHAEGLSLQGDPDAVYRHDGVLTLDGVSFDGQGCAFAALSDGPQALRCLGSNWRIANLCILGVSTRRSDDNHRNGIWIGDGGAHTATDFAIDNVVVDAVEPGRGVAGAGIMFSNARRGRMANAIVRHSLADGIHMTEGSDHLDLRRLLVEDSGDDGVAIVSYRGQRRICHDIAVADAISRRSAARGFSVVGGQDVLYERIRAEESSAAGVYLYGEGGFDTYGVARAKIVDPIVRNCVTGRRLPAGFSNAAIIIGGRAGEDTVEGATLPRGASDCVVSNAVVEGGGDACTAGISLHEFAIRPKIVAARIHGTGGTARKLAANGVEVAGRDVVVDGIEMSDIPGLAILVTSSASGNCVVDEPRVRGSRLLPGPIKSYIYADAAPALRQIVIRDGVFSGGPGTLSISQLRRGQLQLNDNRRS